MAFPSPLLLDDSLASSPGSGHVKSTDHLYVAPVAATATSAAPSTSASALSAATFIFGLSLCYFLTVSSTGRSRVCAAVGVGGRGSRRGGWRVRGSLWRRFSALCSALLCSARRSACYFRYKHLYVLLNMLRSDISF